MRFSATFSNSVREIIFHILTGLTRLSDVQVCALIVKEFEGLEVCGVTDATAAFGKVREDLFTSFRVQSKANNRIAAEIQLNALHAAFRDTSGADEVTMKLKKDANNNIFLTLQARTAMQISVTQDVPVINILQPDAMSRYSEPLIEAADASLIFPELKAAKRVLDRLKQLDKVIHIKADQKHGTLVFRVDTEIVSTRAVFKNLQISPEDVTPETSHGKNEFVVASLSSKEAAAITGAISTFGKRASSTLLAIVRRSLVCIHVNFDNESTLTFYLATTVMEDDQPTVENNQLLRLETVRQEDVQAE